MEKNKPILRMEHNLAACFITLLTFALSFVLLSSEDWSVTLLFSCLLCIVALVSCLLTRPLSRRIILFTDMMTGVWKRILFYIGLLLFDVAIACGGISVVYYVEDMYTKEFAGLGAALGYALIILMAVFSVCVFMLAAYLQTIVVQLVRYIVNRKSETKEKSS